MAGYSCWRSLCRLAGIIKLIKRLMCSRYFRVYGQVQGVAYHYYTTQRAQQLNIKGECRNLDDGSVEVYAYGSQQSLAVLEQWLNSGSPSAVVTKVMSKELSASAKNMKDFKIVG